LNRARIVEHAPTAASAWAYVLVSVEGSGELGTPLVHTWGRAVEPDGRADPADRQRAIALLTAWGHAHGWTMDAAQPDEPRRPNRDTPARMVEPSLPPPTSGRATISVQPPAGARRRYWYHLTVVDGLFAQGTRLHSASARRGPNPPSNRPSPDPREDEEARSRLRTWAAANGWIVVD
jgi:hypothetical protein